ncbi:hypothetical protein HYU14_00880 [Candidatus Woesearchaeota archaeon]|nr:hypothetical protein [Candidatus Woesearchaeota archaeon]
MEVKKAGEKSKRKILIDLDVITVALWNKKKEIVSFIERVKEGEFEVYTPYSLMDLVEQWRDARLRNNIKEFYALYSTEIVSLQRLKNLIEERAINETALIEVLKTKEIKEEDILLVVVTALMNLDFLVTLNRKHLKNKEEVINAILSNHGLKKVKIISPEEV